MSDAKNQLLGRGASGPGSGRRPLQGVYLALAAGLSLTTPAAARAEWIPGGILICGPGCLGREPLIAASPDGGAYIAWRDSRQLLQNLPETVFLQRVTRDGDIAAGWPVNGIQVSRNPPGLQGYAITPDGAGGLYVAWSDLPGRNIFVQRITSAGQVWPGWPVGGLQLCDVSGDQDSPVLVPDDSGVYVIWDDRRAGWPDIYASRVLSSGSLATRWPFNGLALCTAPDQQEFPRATSDGAGGIFVTWNIDRRALPADFYVLRVGPDGLLAPGWQVDGNPFRPGNNYEYVESIAPDGLSGIYVSWAEYSSPSSFDGDVYLLRINADGAVHPGWPSRGVPIATGASAQFDSRLAPDGFGGVIMSWNNGTDIYAQRVRPDGSLAPGWPVGGRFVGGENDGHVAADGLGGAYFAYERWGGPTMVHVQHLDGLSGVVPGWEGGIPALPGATRSQQHPEIVADGLGGAIVVWEDDRRPNYDEIYAQKFGGDGPTPALLSLVSFEAHPDRVSLVWHRSGGEASQATVYRRDESVGWLPLGGAAFDASGVLRFEDRAVAAGRRYAYRLGVRESGAETFNAETWVEVPAALQLALEGLRPNPAVGPLRVALTLPRTGRASLALLDVGGRAVIQREVGGLGPGQHLIPLGEAGDVAPGIYWLRLTTDERSLVARAAVIR